jgi:hypothetical protein
MSPPFDYIEFKDQPKSDLSFVSNSTVEIRTNMAVC